MAKLNQQTSTDNLPHIIHGYLRYLAGVITTRLKITFGQAAIPLEDIPLLNFSASNHPLSIFIQNNDLTTDETLTLLIALAPHVQADFFDSVIQSFFEKPTDFLPIGGVRGKQFRGVLPTGETVLFVLAGNDLEKRFKVQMLFSEAHIFHQKQVLSLEEAPQGEPLSAGRLIMATEYIELFTVGTISKPRFTTSFPAERLQTAMDWENLVLPSITHQEVQELLIWLEHGDTLMQDWGMSRFIKPGYRALFHGPPGTGKTLTAALMGKITERDVYRIDLSMIISKFIGETEKNLANLFDRAENKDWILFFDEADALFGKRTGVRDAHDRYANQEVSYLLQRVETYNGLVILASNFKTNIDDAFIRRFQSIIHFPIPRVGERLKLWQNTFPATVQLAADINLKNMAEKYELTGASIVNIVQFCCLRALERRNKIITSHDIRDGVAKEFGKEGKIFS